MITLYNEEMEAYFRVYACVMDPQGKYMNYEVTTELFYKKMLKNLEIKRDAYRITNAEWQQLKKNLNDWIDFEVDKRISQEDVDIYKEAFEELHEYSIDEMLNEEDKKENWTRYFLVPGEQRYFEILKATPYYNLYNKHGELENEGWYDTLSEVEERAENDIFPMTIEPRSSEDSTFEYKLCRWSGEI